jgi:hypothetical protein
MQIIVAFVLEQNAIVDEHVLIDIVDLLLYLSNSSPFVRNWNGSAFSKFNNRLIFFSYIIRENVRLYGHIWMQLLVKFASYVSLCSYTNTILSI